MNIHNAWKCNCLEWQFAYSAVTSQYLIYQEVMLMTCSTCIFVLCIYCEARLLTFSSLNCRYLSFIHATKCFSDFFFFWLYHPCIWSTVAWRIIVWLQEKEIGIKNSRIRYVNILLLGIAFKKYGFTFCFICWNALCNYNAIETFVIFFFSLQTEYTVLDSKFSLCLEAYLNYTVFWMAQFTKF